MKREEFVTEFLAGLDGCVVERDIGRIEIWDISYGSKKGWFGFGPVLISGAVKSDVIRWAEECKRVLMR